MNSSHGSRLSYSFARPSPRATGDPWVQAKIYAMSWPARLQPASPGWSSSWAQLSGCRACVRDLRRVREKIDQEMDGCNLQCERHFEHLSDLATFN